MHRFLSLAGRFARDERGVFAIMFGLMAVVLVAMGGAVVDYVSLEQTRNRAQVALDAAALALQQEVLDGTSDSVIGERAQALLTDRIGDASVFAEILTVRSDLEEGLLYLEAEMTVPTLFVGLVGVPELKARIVAEAIRRMSELEVVMVLDNSGSMNDYYNNLNQFRMTNLVNAARSATEILYNESLENDPNVKMAIVPFTQFVNVGANNGDQPWINRSGANPIMRDNFDDDANLNTLFDATNPAFDRINLFRRLRGNHSWGGCVEARQHPYDTNDTAPNTAATQFVPLFAPDEPDTGGFQNSYLSDTGGICTNVAEPNCTVVRTYRNINNRNQLSGLQSTSYSFKPATGQSQTVPACPAAYNTWIEQSTAQNNSSKTITTVYYSNRVRQERICKYDGGTVTKASRNLATGPNVDCPIHPIVPLTYEENTVLDAIERMRPNGNTNQPEGGTNIAQGAVWGLHVLSPGQPFDEGDDAGRNVKKVMILMTDGDNFTSQSSNMNGSTFYPAYGYPYNNSTRADAGRLGQPGSSTNQVVAEMNARTLAACTEAKTGPNKIEIFTIGLYSTTAATIQMLKDCSTDAGTHYYPATANNLSAVFQSIARQLQPLRLNQ